MSILDGLWVLILGALAVPNLILAKRPDAKQILDKITPYQGWIGLISAIWGLIRIPALISALTWMKFGVRGLIAFIIYAAFVVVQVCLGFVLSIGIIKGFVKDVNAQAKMDSLLARIIPHQATLGILAMIDGIIIVIVALVPRILF
jgi:hypothetical protein